MVLYDEGLEKLKAIFALGCIDTDCNQLLATRVCNATWFISHYEIA